MTATSGDKAERDQSRLPPAGAPDHWDHFRANDGLVFASALHAIWLKRHWIIASVLIASAGAVLYALLATQWYRAEVLLMPREDDTQSGLAAQLAQLGGLSELTGIRIGSGNKQEPLGVLRSRGFSRRFIEASNLEEQIARELLLGGYGSGSVDTRRVVDEFKRSVLLISEDKKSGIVTVAVLWVDADLAAKWANTIVRQVNDEMRLRALHEAERNIQFLRSQLVTTDTVSLQQAIARLIESEMQKAMLARGTDEYAFRVIDFAEPPLKAAKPRRSLTIVVTILTSAFVSVLAVLLIHAIKGTLQLVRGK